MGAAYEEFLESRVHSESAGADSNVRLNSNLMPFQEHLVKWAIGKGRGAIFADCGLGKTLMQLAWCSAISEKALVLTPLAVGSQTMAEASKFGIEGCSISRDGNPQTPITITNYERLHYFNPDDFDAVVCDESSILKNYDGKRRHQITKFLKRIEHRLLCTATAAPNDFTELGTSSEALGLLGHTDMTSRFFTNKSGSVKGHRPSTFYPDGTDKFRLKPHAEDWFWDWVSTWARSLRKPSDLGFDDGDFKLPELKENIHIVEAKTKKEGMLFSLPAVGLSEEREERRRTLSERCDMAAQLARHDRPAVMWVQLNDEGDELERLMGTDCVQVSGKDSDEQKEDKFASFAGGESRVLITKPKIGGFGLNWQHCAHQTMFATHSYEQYYQGIRRCWRFGQSRPVVVDLVISEGEKGVIENLHRKADDSVEMFSSLVSHMSGSHIVDSDRFDIKEEIPSWL